MTLEDSTLCQVINVQFDLSLEWYIKAFVQGSLYDGYLLFYTDGKVVNTNLR